MKRPNKACDSRLLAAALAAVSLIAAATPTTSQAHVDCVAPLHGKTIGALPTYWVDVTIGRDYDPPGVTVRVMVDTGFAGDLSLPRPLVEYLRAHKMAVLGQKVINTLADGSQIENDTLDGAEVTLPGCAYAIRFLQIIAMGDQATPLIGQDLLSEFASSIDYENLRLVLWGRGRLSPLQPPCFTCRPAPGAKPFFLGETPR
jgi:predicted aspartyl protease